MATSLLYVSRICLDVGNVSCAIDKVSQTIGSRCESRGITGTIICLRSSLAQIMEGPAEDLHAVLSEQQGDWWQTKGMIISEVEVETRRFEDWRVAYSGTSFFVEDRILPFFNDKLNDAERYGMAAELIKIIEIFRFDD